MGRVHTKIGPNTRKEVDLTVRETKEGPGENKLHLPERTSVSFVSKLWDQDGYYSGFEIPFKTLSVGGVSRLEILPLLFL